MTPSQPHFTRRRVLQSLTATALASGIWLHTAQAAEAIVVTASFSILADLVRAVGGNRVVVNSLVGPDEDAHAFEPKPADAKTILQSQLLVINGLGFEPWAQKLAKSAGYKGQTVLAAQGIKPRVIAAEKGHGHAHAESDPHAWQNPQNVVIYVNNIAAALTALDPAGATSYANNAQNYAKELQALDAWAQAQFSAIPHERRKIITAHDAFGYLAARYQIRFFAPQGLSTDTEPSAKQVAQLIRQIQREKIKTVFVENMGNPKLMTQLGKDTGATVGAKLYADALSAPNQAGASYLGLMRHNINHMVASMQ